MSVAIVAWVVGMAAMTGLAAWAFYRPHEPLTWCELQLPEELAAEAVTALLRHVAGVRQGPVSFLVIGEPGRMRFRLGASERVVQSILAAASGLVPELRAEAVPATDVPVAASGRARIVGGVRVGWHGPWPLLRQKEPQLCAAGLLGALASARSGERLQLLVRLWPVAGRVNRPVPVSERGSVPPNPWFMRPLWPAEPPREEVAAIRAKFGGLLGAWVSNRGSVRGV